VYFERPQVTEGSSSEKTTATRDISQQLEEGGHQCVIFWGSQSGTSERFAETLGRECLARFDMNALVADLSDYEAESIAKIQKKHLAIFIISTYGEGDPSDNTAGLWNWIKRLNKDETRLENLRYLAFGLGNSNYKYYNRVIDVVADALDAAGATALMSRQKADDANGGTEEDFQAWKDDVFASFRSLGFTEKELKYQPIVNINFTSESAQHNEPIAMPAHHQSTTNSAIVALTIKSSRELFTAGDRNCVHMELDLGNSDIVYKTGDHIGIWPINPEEEIDRLLGVLGLESRRHERFALTSENRAMNNSIPTPTTLNTALRHHLEICRPVSRKTMLEAAQFAPTPEAKSMLLELAQDREHYEQFTAITHTTFARLLKLASPAAPWTSMPLSFVIENLVPIQPRYYSISSSSIISPRRITITALVVNKPLSSDQPENIIPGLTSNYLLSASTLRSNAICSTPTYRHADGSEDVQGSKVLAHVRKSKFKLPITASTPLIMISAGTGFAPFRAFIQERAKLHALGKPIGNMVLFFGCRDHDDYIYRDELVKIQEQLGDKLHIVTAFSRLNGEPRTYVQERVAEQAGRLLDMLDKGANMYICGKAAMAREVDMKLEDAIRAEKNLNDAQVKDWADALKRRGKWRADVWG
jgi:NADPH-ferrihemoprotein reductase